MSEMAAVILSRAIERIVVVIIGGLCIYLGWELFKRLPPDGKSDLTAGWGAAKIVIRRIGPGVIFAAFGSAIVTVSFLKPVSFKEYAHPPTAESQANTGQIFMEYSGAVGDNAQQEQAKAEVVALNKVLKVINTDPKRDSAVFDARLDNLTRDKERILALRDRQVALHEGTALMKLWSENGEVYRHHPESLSEKQRTELKEIAPWFEAD